MKAGREVDALIADKVMGHDMENDFCPICDDSFTFDRPTPHYSTHIADAWLVVEKLRDNEWVICTDYPTGWVATVGIATGEGRDARAATAPLAICLAALKAVSEDV